MSEAPNIAALAPWFGSNRTLAATVGQQLRGCKWVGIPFCGGCSELPFIEARGGIANDLHRHVINLARVIADPAMKPELIARLDGLLFHPDTLAKAQWRCRQREEESQASGLFNGQPAPFVPVSLTWAVDYFVTVWMGRGGKAGVKGEFKGALPSRWNANGGGSNVRYRSAVEAIEDWHHILKRWEWECMDAFEFLASIRESVNEKLGDRGVYADPPWVEVGADYVHAFTERQHRRLAQALSAYEKVRVVVRYGDHDLVRELYRPPKWTIIEQDSRDQANQSVAEILIVNGAAYA